MNMSTLGSKKGKKPEGNQYALRWAPYAGGGSGTASSGSSTPSIPVSRSVSADGNLLTTDEYLFIDATIDRAFTLDTPSAKKAYYLKITTGDGNVTLTPASGNIDGSANLVFSGEQSSLGLFWDGTNWWTFLS